MQLWNAHLLICGEPQRELCFEIVLKLNSTLRSPKQVKFGAPSRTTNSNIFA
jgi:hypothetical protein